MRMAVRLTPKGGRDALQGWGQDGEGRPYLKVRVSAPPVDGAANAALLAFLAKTLRRPRSSLRIVSGETARLKLVEIDDLSDEEAARAFGSPP
ncbi:DUF167 family protein [Phenylobacterium sp.]|uniref:DUF167 family protein n=1 Tax=Phenylobacterium sp. TaxID=1871053 RepID=UPI00272F2A28|nr:DUF167 family protein [Phenylobacterium sp.]MDP1617822.1 DUF167 family protein [Phenylobacterium sp.]MDP1987490.1 DUF167 family protein [Phenylobacterium sp.]